MKYGKRKKDVLSLEEKEKEQRQKTFNGMTAREWTINSRSVWNDLSSVRKRKHLNHGATYPEKLCDRVISMYSKEKTLYLTRFLGQEQLLFLQLKTEGME